MTDTSQFTLNMPDTSRRYTAEEKEQLLANLDIEVAHKLRQFESWLADALENFRLHQEGLISRIPKPVRSMTLREFEKYGGDVQAALCALQKEKLGGGPETAEIDKQTRKRKWVASQEPDAADASGSGTPKVDVESSRARKTARITDDTGKAKPGSSTGPGTAQHARLQLVKTPNKTSRMTAGVRAVSVTASPSPQKTKLRFGTFGRPPPRLASPSKLNASPQQPDATPRPTRPPSRATFNPVLPPKIPHYPNHRLPRLNESMVSMNGSPLANPYGVNPDWFASSEAFAGDDKKTAPGGKNKKKTAKPKDRGSRNKTIGRGNSISIRRDPSVNGLESRTNSQTSVPPSSSTTHSRTNSESESYPIQSQHRPIDPINTRPLSRTQSQNMLPPAALIAIPTKDGHLLEFDPVQTSPSALDSLEGITDSAKKQAKEDVGKLVRAAVDKWKIK